MYTNSQVNSILAEYIHNRQDREVMTIYLTDRPRSLEALAEECDLSVSTIKRIIGRNQYILRYLHIEEPELN